MTPITLDMLESEEMFFDGIEAVPQRWPQAVSYFEYLTQPRPNTGLFFLRADMKATLNAQDGTAFTFGRGGVALLPKGARYRFTFEGGDKCDGVHSFVVNFTPHSKTGEEQVFATTPLLITENDALNGLPLPALVRAVHDLPRNHLKVHSLFFRVMEGVFDMVHEQNVAFYPIRRGVKLLRREWKENEKISRYATESGMSESYFHALFRAWAGVTPVQYRNRLRISYACSYLKNGEEKIEDIAREVGFEDPFYFSHLFKKVMGVTPREYRKA